MSIGYTSEQLVSIFVKSWTERQKTTPDLIIREVVKMDSEMLDNLRKQIPTLDAKSLAAILSFVFALGDMIARNNESLAKVIPHVDS